MISEADKKIIREVSQKYHARRVLLFGSNASSETDGRDIDIAVQGVPPELFYNFYGELMFSLSKPVDVVDLSGSSKFIDLVEKEGVFLYG